MSEVSEAAEPVGAGPTLAGISGNPTDDDVAAIVAAIEVAWPRGGVAQEAPTEVSRWRFSGRWWSKPLPSRRERP